MSLFDRIKRAKTKADKLSKKSKKAESKGKEGKAARLEKRSEKKSIKANKLGGKLAGKIIASTYKGMTFGTGETMQDTGGEKTHTFKKSGPKDTSYKEKSAPYHGKVDKNGNPPR